MGFGCLVLKLQRRCKKQDENLAFLVFYSYSTYICSEGAITPEHWEETFIGSRTHQMRSPARQVKSKVVPREKLVLISYPFWILYEDEFFYLLIYFYRRMENQQQKSQSALREEAILQFWKENNVFEKTLAKDSPAGEFVFFEGPPTANGKPGIHHLEARAFKDAIPRYKTMRGYHVSRKGGWDTHGLPVELQVEKKLGLNSKKGIEEYGIAKFNKECKESVGEYLDIWGTFTTRIGYWVDQENSYFTYYNNYIESVWNVLKHVHEQGLVYKDYRIVPWCARCGTALSSHELAQGYEDVKDLSVYAKFRISADWQEFLRVLGQAHQTSQKPLPTSASILAWTTTPWTLPGNVALAVGKDMEYVALDLNNEIIILAKSRLSLIEGEYTILAEIKGSDLVGLSYEPLYPYFADTLPEGEKGKLEKAFKVYGADFVTTEDGTGVVHTAVMYGADDFALGTEIGLPKHHLVGLDGKFITGTGSFEGRFVKDEDVAVDVIKDLAGRGLLFKKEKYEHSYPHCWRCKTPLIYYARDSWYIRMSSLRDKLVEENKSINWEPDYIRDGRFGEWLKDIKDWAISRERYWGTPLPLWNCESCKKVHAIGSIEELKSKTKKSGNQYFVMRHGETEANLKGLVSSIMNSGSHLTEEGKAQIRATADELKKEGIDVIISSPFVRTRETTEIMCDVLGIDKDSVVYEDRLGEMSLPAYEGKTWAEYHTDYPKTVENFTKAKEGDESYADVKRRVSQVLHEIESTYKGKKILIVTHGGPAWLMVSGAHAYTAQESLGMITDKKDFHYLSNGGIMSFDFTPLPHNEEYELDLHRPYIDDVSLACDCGGELSRTKEVMDVWFDSGAMPFAQSHYPFENKEWVEQTGYPADYISEAIDQTRGWFYTLHAVGILMGRGKAYKNVICLGHILDDKGKKMSKSLGNIVDPWVMMDKYGVDTLRLWMYSVNQPGESKNFDEKTVFELHNKVFNLLYNVVAFYELYRDVECERIRMPESKNILDQWIVERFNQLASSTTEHLDNFRLLEPVRLIRDFIDDLSTWYLRRSRDRIKDGDKDAKQTLYYILNRFSTVLAPFAPFTAEDLWQRLPPKDGYSEILSVHMCAWPSGLEVHNQEILTDMETLRQLVTLGLEARQKAGIKVRQPLQSLKVKSLKLEEAYIEILKDELNVKEIVEDATLEQDVLLDTHITPELRSEGQYRELVRAVQDMRKKAGLNPSDTIVLSIETDTEGQGIVTTFKDDFLKTVGASELQFTQNEGTEIKIDELVFKVFLS